MTIITEVATYALILFVVVVGVLVYFVRLEINAVPPWAHCSLSAKRYTPLDPIPWSPSACDNVSAGGYWRSIETVAASKGAVPMQLPVHDSASIQQAVDEFASVLSGGLVLPTDVTTIVHRDLIIALAACHRLPAAYSHRADVASGGLMSYVPDMADLFQRAASYISRILKGEKPADLPVEQPTKFELVINLKTAKALGLDVPLHLQQLADQVIE